MSFKSVFCFLSAVVMTMFMVSAARAQENPVEKTHNHTLGSASDVWRIELRQPNRYLKMTSGDSDGVSELNKVSVRLEGLTDQYHAFEETAPYIDTRANSTNTYLRASTGSQIHLTRLTIRDRNGYNLWIHDKQRDQDDVNPRQRDRRNVSRPTVNFRIIVNSRELDCAFDNICNRGDNGKITYFVNLEIPRIRSNRCVPANSYRITAVNGSTMVLRPKTADREIRTVHHENQDDGPHLALQMGEICIASTSR